MSKNGVPADVEQTAGGSGEPSPRASSAVDGSGGSSPGASTLAGGSGGSSPRASLAPRPMRADAQRNYQRLLDAAVASFAEHGADDVSLEEIARRAGVGIGTLYRHFPARQALLEAVYKDQVDGLDTLGAKLVASESPGDALGDWMRAFVAFGRTKRSLSSALVETIGKNSELMSACSMILRGRTEELLSRAQDAGEARPEVRCGDI